MRTKYNKRRFRTIIMIIICLFCMSIGYSYLLTTLNIEGTSNIKANSWDVHWENVSVKSGSVTGDQVPIAAHIMSNTTQAEYSVILKNPGEYYEFTIDAKNAGSLDAMVSVVETKFYESNGVTQISLPNYLEYECVYSNGVTIAPNQILAANTKETLKVRMKYSTNLDESELPTTDKTIIVRQSITYIQADENAVNIPTKFEQDSWLTINYNITLGSVDYYNIGDTKEIDLGSFGTHTVRIANKSIPSECENSDFSQTACGFVLEFTDIIAAEKYNLINTNEDGWVASQLRTYLNNTIYSSLPTDIRNGIPLTKVVSGNLSGYDNIVTTDRMYLLAPHEVYEDNDGNPNAGVNHYDTAYNDTRLLDYYADANSSRIKKWNGSNASWWLRTVFDDYDVGIFVVSNTGSLPYISPNSTSGVSPAFRYGQVF